MERERLAQAGQETTITPVGITTATRIGPPPPRREISDIEAEDRAGITTQQTQTAAGGGGGAALGLLAVAGIAVFLLTRK